MSEARSVIIHGHFYQPPRENPWLDEVEAEPSARPFHDWNERIEAECYRTVAAARLVDGEGRIVRVMNALEYMSFNFGPTLLEWMERKAPDTYARILAADRESERRIGHGNAIAQPYHHAILPLGSWRDKRTEVRWGIADFRRRYGREPVGMWLPETAVDDETLDVLAAEGIRFTILAPYQVEGAPDDGSPVRYVTRGGRTIVIFPYDGRMSHDVAFGAVLRNGVAWLERLLAVPATGTSPRLITVATDGETYGHHQKFAEMALAFVLDVLERTPTARVENGASWLARHDAEELAMVQLVEPSAWSCAHGVGRWSRDCGCHMREGTQQSWRAPLREAIDDLASGLGEVYERESVGVFAEPWEIRDAFGGVVGASPDAIEAFAAAASGGSDVQRALELLELARGGLRIFTSCAWFFDDIAGIEAVQVLRYAARALELAGPDRERLERAFLDMLERAVSNDPGEGTGRDVFLRRARPPVVPALRLAASVGAACAIAPDDPRSVASAPAIAIARDGDRVRVTERRIGRVTNTVVAVTREGTSDVRGAARAEGDGTATSVALDDMTESQRDAIRDGLRRALLETTLPAELRLRVASGEVTLAAAIGVALCDEFRSLEQQTGALDTVRAHALLDLLHTLGAGVPFDAQTAFAEAFVPAPDSLERRAALAGLAHRLGFAVPEPAPTE
jgi:hypothetical protein